MTNSSYVLIQLKMTHYKTQKKYVFFISVLNFFRIPPPSAHWLLLALHVKVRLLVLTFKTLHFSEFHVPSFVSGSNLHASFVSFSLFCLHAFSHASLPNRCSPSHILSSAKSLLKTHFSLFPTQSDLIYQTRIIHLIEPSG